MARKGSDHPGWLDQEDYATALKLVPMACVDLLPLRRGSGGTEIGLIERDDAEGGRRYALVGGGILRGESIAEAGTRHLRETLGDGISWQRSLDEPPDLVLQYFPDGRDGYGKDTRKHSIGLSYLLEIKGEAASGGEAESFRWFPLDELPPRSEYGFRQWLAVESLLGLTLAD